MNQEYALLPTNEFNATSNDSNSEAHSRKWIYTIAGGIYIALLTTGTVAVIVAVIPASTIATWLTAAGCAHLIPGIPVIHEAAHFLATGGFGVALFSDALIAAAAAALRTMQGLHDSGYSFDFPKLEEFKKHFKEAKHDIKQTVGLEDYDKLHDQVDNLMKGQNIQSEIIASQKTTINSHKAKIEMQQSQIDGHKATIDSHKATIDIQQSQIESHNETIDKQQLQIDTHKQIIFKQQSQIYSHKKTIDSHKKTIDSHEATIDNHEKTIAKLKETIDTQQSQIDSQEKTIAELKEAIYTQQSQISRLEATNARQDTRLAGLDNSIAELMQAMQSMQHDFQQASTHNSNNNSGSIS